MAAAAFGLQSPSQGERRVPGKPGRVLLVDDEEVVSTVYARQLVRLGFEVEVVHDAAAAAERCRRERFDVLVSDVSMPNMTGLDLLRSVREHDLDLPVVLMTGGPDVQDAIKAMEFGAFRYMAKPIPLPEFASVVTRAARLNTMARLRREASEAEGGPLIADRAGLETRFNNALANLRMAYQPIVSWSKRSIFAYEALVRTGEPSLARPDVLLDVATRLERLHELGRRIRGHVAETIRTQRPKSLVFVNLHTEDLNDEELFAPDAPLSEFAGGVVLEITERAALEKIDEPMRRMARLRAMGYRVAVDDLGAGYAGLTSFAQLEPEVVKVDMSLIRGIDQSPTKRRLVGSIVDVCRDLNIQFVAEGIETMEERDTLVRLGGDLCQGYLFARPEPPFVAPKF